MTITKDRNPTRNFSFVAFRSHPEQLDTVGRCERVERYVPFVGWDRFRQPLQRPADADQPRAAFLESRQRAVVMTLAPAESGAGAVNRDQGHEDEVGLDYR